MQDDFSTSPIEPSESKRIQKMEQQEATKLIKGQIASEINMKELAQDPYFTPVNMNRRNEPLENKTRKRTEKAEKEEQVTEVEKVEELAEEFNRKNPELESRSLQQLRAQIRQGDSAEDILGKVRKHYPDPSLADESLEFLEQTTTDELGQKVRQAKENLNSIYGREIKAGRNMAAEARAFSKEGLGSPTGLRDLYRDITGNPREPTTLFLELRETFTFEQMKTAIDFLLHSLGADLKSKGPSIPPGLLHTLVSQARNLLAILWVYKFFRGRMDLIRGSFERAGMLLPSRITFEMLAKMFVQFLTERYPSMDKVFQLALKMGISADLMAQIILFTQMRDGVRGVAPKLFKNEQHRHDVLMSFLEALEELEEQLEEGEEEDEEEEEEGE